MSPTARRPRTSFLLAALIAMASLGSGVTPARATGHQIWWVATSGTAANPPSAGSSCANPGFVGATDEAIQAAIDAVGPGDEIKICAGSYSVSTTLTIAFETTLTGVGAQLPVLDGGGTTRIMDITSGGFAVTINNLHFRNGRSVAVDQANPDFSGAGAGIRVHPDITLNVNESLFVNNLAEKHGGGIAMLGNGNSGSIHVHGSTFYKNQSLDGGGVALVGNTTNPSTVESSTFVNNSATREGGALNGSFASMLASNSTFIDNVAASGGQTSWVVSIEESLIGYTSPTGPSSGVCENGSPLVNNVSTSASCLAGGDTPVTSASLALGFLAPWGGPVPTFSIGSGSSAIAAIPAADCPTNDQRGVSRTGGNCDAGAFEFVASPPSLTASSSIALVGGFPVTGSPTFTKNGLTEPVVLRVATEVDGALPSGLAFSSSTGAITGTPSSTYASPFIVVSATDAGGNVASARIDVENCVLTLDSGEYLIGSVSDLELFELGFCGMGADYALTADIAWNGTWSPNISPSNRFTGVFDGRGYSITGLQISGGETAFIPYANGATIKNLNFSATVSGTYSTSGLVRSAVSTVIDNVHGSGAVNITGDHGCHGGLAGETDINTIFTNSSFEGTINAPDSNWNGGLVGCAYNTTVIETSYFDGTVTGKSDIGGLVGWMDRTEIRNSYAIGSVASSVIHVGGLVGWMDGDGTDSDTVAVENSYSRMAIQGTSDIGALIGEGNPTAISNSFWEEGLAGVDGLDPIGLLTPSGTQPSIVPTPTASMKSFSFFDNAGWSIVNGWVDPTTTQDLWGICDGERRPFLLWEHTTDVCANGAPSTPNPSTPPSSAPGTTSPVATAPGTTAPITSPTSDSIGPIVTTGGQVVIIDGQPVNSNIAWSGGTRVSGRIGVVDVSLNFESGLVDINLPSTFRAGAQISLVLNGLQPGSPLTATMFSTPTTLGRFTADDAGTLSATFSLPISTPSGSHRIRLDMTGSDGRSISIWLGVDVQATPDRLPATGTDSSATTAMAILIVAVGLLVLGLSRRRHRM